VSDRPTRELYARSLDRATKAGFVIALSAFLIYVSGALPAYVPVTELVRYWSLPVDRFIAVTGASQGWAWLRLLGYGDALNVAAVALLALVTPLCYARLLPVLVAERDWLQAALAAAQLAVLLTAASGLVSALG